MPWANGPGSGRSRRSCAPWEPTSCAATRATLELGRSDLFQVRGFDPAGERDIAFIPVGITYDRTLEDRTLLSEQAPDFEKPGAATALSRTLKFFVRNLRLLAANQWHRFGYACVNFGTPLSLKSWATAHAVVSPTGPPRAGD